MEKGDERREAFLKRAAEWYDRMVARAEEDTEDVFDDIEEQAERMGREATRGLIEARLEAEEARRSETVPCPDCGWPMRRPSAEAQRDLETALGPVRYRRRHAVCDRCGKSFSPAGPPPEDPAPGGVGPVPPQGL